MPNEEVVRSLKELENRSVQASAKLMESMNPRNDCMERPAPPKGSGGASQTVQAQAQVQAGQDRPTQPQPKAAKG